MFWPQMESPFTSATSLIINFDTQRTLIREKWTINGMHTLTIDTKLQFLPEFIGKVPDIFYMETLL